IVLVQNLPDSVQVDGMISDMDGEFEITNIKEGEYLLKIQYLGYENLFKSIHVARNMDLGVLNLQEESTDLEEVTISARRAQGEQKGDT
ncbi:carboxypeptidase-like regulatory domain-containing protein, partial [Campylobacter fetus subsp. venerealis]